MAKTVLMAANRLPALYGFGRKLSAIPKADAASSLPDVSDGSGADPCAWRMRNQPTAGGRGGPARCGPICRRVRAFAAVRAGSVRALHAGGCGGDRAPGMAPLR